MRLVLKTKEIILEEDLQTVEVVLKTVSTKYEGTTLKELKNCIIFVNGKNIVDLKRFRTKLNNGDEIQLFSAVGGG
jgi:molybdopterin converting factor small subunit